MRRSRRRSRSSTPGPAPVAWWWLVAASALVLVVVAAVLVVWCDPLARDAHDAVPHPRRRHRPAAGRRRRRRGDRRRRDRDRGAPDRRVLLRQARPTEEPRVENGTVSVVSRCPEQVLGSCRVQLPADRARQRADRDRDLERRPWTSRACARRSQISTGSGAIRATGFCGFSLRAVSDTGNVSTMSECSADRLELRSRTGDVRAIVPAGPLHDRRAERHRRGPHARAGPHRGRAVPDPGAVAPAVTSTP